MLVSWGKGYNSVHENASGLKFSWCGNQRTMETQYKNQFPDDCHQSRILNQIFPVFLKIPCCVSFCKGCNMTRRHLVRKRGLTHFHGQTNFAANVLPCFFVLGSFRDNHRDSSVSIRCFRKADLELSSN